MEWNNDLDLFNMLTDAKRYKLICFKESLIVGCWSLWNHMNRCIFDNHPISLDIYFQDFLSSFDLVRHKAKPSLKEGMTQWVDTLWFPFCTPCKYPLFIKNKWCSRGLPYCFMCQKKLSQYVVYLRTDTWQIPSGWWLSHLPFMVKFKLASVFSIAHANLTLIDTSLCHLKLVGPWCECIDWLFARYCF